MKVSSILIQITKMPKDPLIVLKDWKKILKNWDSKMLITSSHNFLTLIYFLQFFCMFLFTIFSFFFTFSFIQIHEEKPWNVWKIQGICGIGKRKEKNGKYGKPEYVRSLEQFSKERKKKIHIKVCKIHCIFLTKKNSFYAINIPGFQISNTFWTKAIPLKSKRSSVGKSSSFIGCTTRIGSRYYQPCSPCQCWQSVSTTWR